MGGFGFGRLADGLVVLVPHVLPGEMILVRPVRKKKSYLEARLVEVLEPSRLRAEPRCPLYGQCGGCNFQHVRPDEQPQLKSVILQDQLLRAGVLTKDEMVSVLSAPLASPLLFHYRQRIRLRINGHGECGFFRHRSHQIVPVDHCFLARQRLNQVLGSLNDTSCSRHLLGLSSMVELSLSPDRETVYLFFHFSRKPRARDIKAAKESAARLGHIGAVHLVVEGQGRFGPFYSQNQDEQPLLSLSVPVPGKQKICFQFEPGTFCQINLEQNEQLLGLLLDWADVRDNDQVLDLFCGMGNFSLPLALFAGRVKGMDLQRSAIRSAWRSAGEAGIDNCRFERQAAVDGAKACLVAKECFDLILLDPPRQGCRDVLAHVIALQPARIIYISCDPATLCRDLGILLEKGYRLQRMKMVDMFPQTHHLESITLLER